jgi:Ulp1 family protease
MVESLSHSINSVYVSPDDGRPKQLYAADLDRLGDGQWVNDSVVDFGFGYVSMKLLYFLELIPRSMLTESLRQQSESERARFHIYCSFFYTKLAETE